MQVDLKLIERIAAELAPYRDDEEVYWTTLDGETDAEWVLDHLIADCQRDAAMIEAIGSQITALRARSDRIEMRQEAARKLIGDVLHAASMTKAERPCATVSVRPGNLSVRIVDEAEIPSQLMREKITRSPDKTAIKAQIEAGETVPGAELVRGDDVVTMRVK